MSFNEDYSRIRKGNAPHVMAIIRHLALNLLQRGKPKRNPLRDSEKFAPGIMLYQLNLYPVKC
jgi:hypothetical protein